MKDHTNRPERVDIDSELRAFCGRDLPEPRYDLPFLECLSWIDRTRVIGAARRGEGTYATWALT